MRLLSLDPLAADSVGNGSTFQLNRAASGPRSLTIQWDFARAAGGTSCDAFLQTSFDGGGTWNDISQFHGLTTSLRKMVNLTSTTAVTTQATGTDGALGNNASVDGFIGTHFRVKYVTAGTYSGASYLHCDVQCSGGLVPT